MPAQPGQRPSIRIVSLVPSWTASIVDLGLEDELVGCTTFCSRPSRLRNKTTSIGGTKDANFAAIQALNPTHIISCEEENSSETLAQIEAELPKAHLIRTFPKSPEDSLQDLSRIAEALEAPAESLNTILDEIFRMREQLQRRVEHMPTEKYLYFIWRNPWMLAGNQSYISALLAEGRLSNLVITGSMLHERYPCLDPSSHKLDSNPWCLFSSEPYPFKSRHLDEFSQAYSTIRRGQCLKVNGQALSWYGSLLSEGYQEVIRIRDLITDLKTSEQPS